MRIGGDPGEPSDEPLQWMVNAREYLDIGTMAFCNATPGSDMPGLVLLGYALELAMKGLLLQKKVATLEDVKKLGHDLDEIRAKAVNEAGMPPDLLHERDAEHLAQIFYAWPRSGGSKGKLRSGIYPTTAKRWGYSAFGDFFVISVEAVIDHCAEAVVGTETAELWARDRAGHRQDREQEAARKEAERKHGAPRLR